jgi:hypothetical protein
MFFRWGVWLCVCVCVCVCVIMNLKVVVIEGSRISLDSLK